MIRAFVYVLFLMQTSFACAQYTEKIVSGRPGQAIASQTPGKHVFQLETGFDHSGFQILPSGFTKHRAVLNATLIRFGILNKLEIHSGWEFRDDKRFNNDEITRSYSGIGFSSLGIRHNLLEGGGKKPSLAYQVSAKLPILSDGFKSDDKIMPQFMITSSLSLTSSLGITLNSGMDFSDATSDSWIYIINFGYSLTDKSFTFIEMYGSQTVFTVLNDDFAPKFDAGFGYFISNDLQLDVLGGYALNNNFEEFFISVGLSWRLNHPKEMPAE